MLWSASEKLFPIKSTIVASSKDLQSEKSNGGGLYWGWRLNADTSTSLHKIEFLLEWQERSQLLQVSGGAHLYGALRESTLEWSELSFRSSVFWGLFFFLFQTCISCYSGLSISQPGYWSAPSSLRSSMDGPEYFYPALQSLSWLCVIVCQTINRSLKVFLIQERNPDILVFTKDVWGGTVLVLTKGRP